MRNSSRITFDQRQLTAIEHVHGPMLVVAGAGTGKTLVLTQRITRLIEEGHAHPQELLALTYSDNAARELCQRAAKLAGKRAADLHGRTFHAYCFALLCRHGRDFRVVTREDLWVFLRRRISELGLQHFVKAANPGEFLDDLLTFFERCHDELVGAADYQAYVERVRSGELPLPRVAKSKHMAELPREEALSRCQEIARVYNTVDRMLAEKNLGTFGHMIVRAVQLLRQNPELLEQERSNAKFILIDEFQDSNVGQIELAKLLAGEEQNVFAVGDPDQAIYRFRGATSGAFDEFLKRFPGSQKVVLERNHRSTEKVLACAFALISRNPPIVRSGSAGGLKFERQPLRSARVELAKAEGSEIRTAEVQVVLTPAAETEAAEIVESMRRLRKAWRARWSDFAVLYRSHHHRDRLTQELASRSVPFLVSGIDVLETTPVRDVLALLHVLAGCGDAASLLRVAALPEFKLSPEALRAAFVEAGRNAVPAEVFKKVPGGAIVIEEVERLRNELNAREAKASAVLAGILKRFRIEAGDAPLAAFSKFVADWEQKPITERGDLREFLDYLEYFVMAGGTVALPEMPFEHDAVRLLTAHAAKGLEFAHVFIMRVNTGTFPGHYREPLFAFPNELRHSEIEGRDEKSLHLEEERRLLYVGMTRAKDSLGLYAKPGRGRDATPSGFLRDLLKDKNIAASLACRTAQPLQIELPVPVPPETISNVAPWILMPARSALSNLTLSATAIETYERCPLQFKIAHDWRLPGEAVAAMHFGSAMHTTLKHYFDSVRSGTTPGAEVAIQFFEQALAATPVEEPLQRELYRKYGSAQLRTFVERLAAGAMPQVLDTERTFRVEVGGATVTGRVDRLDSLGGNRVAITDYKTGSPRSQDDADKSLQLSLYALAAQRAWNVDPQVLMFYNLDTNIAIQTSRSADDLRVTEEKVREVAADIAASIFDAKPGRHCRTCGYRTLCPATEQKLYTIETMQAVAASH